jgi:hypothetical protein
MRDLGVFGMLIGSYGSLDSSVGIATDYGMDDRDSIPGRVKRYFSSPWRPDRLWSPPSLLYNGYRGIFR